MRSLTSTQTRKPLASTVTPVAKTVSTHASSTPASRDSLSVETPTTPLSSSVKTRLQAENSKLKEELSEVKKQMRCVLDHSIESDTRLLQYTSDIFAANTSREESLKHTVMTDAAVQCVTPTECLEEQCVVNRDLIARLRISVEVLEEEVRCLRGELRQLSDVSANPESGEWTTVARRAASHINPENRLEKEISTLSKRGQINLSNKNSKENKTARQDRTGSLKAALPFEQVTIFSDSHGRNLAGLLGSMTNDEGIVTGICKPSARLRSILPVSPMPPKSCCVIIAGTNDVAVGLQNNIYTHLEPCINSLLVTSKVMVSTLPTRYDLPIYHPVNEEIIFVNAYITELCDRYDGVKLLNINTIDRRGFTRHGMHLTRRGKHRLARLILNGMLSMTLDQRLPYTHSVPATCAPITHSVPATCAPITQPTSVTHPAPITHSAPVTHLTPVTHSAPVIHTPPTIGVTGISHETYAEAVRFSSARTIHSATQTQPSEKKTNDDQGVPHQIYYDTSKTINTNEHCNSFLGVKDLPLERQYKALRASLSTP